MTALRITVEPELGEPQLHADWQLDCLAHHPGRQAVLCRDARWQAEVVSAWDGDRLAGCAVLARPAVATLADPELRRALELVGVTDPTQVLLLGSPVEYAAGVALTGDRPEVRRVLVAAAVRTARERQLGLAVLFGGPALVGELAELAETTDLTGTRLAPAPAVPLTERGAIIGPFADFEQYLAAQSRDRRAMIRRELRTVERLGLAAEVVDLDTALAAGACDLIAELKQRHGIPEPPRLVRMRVERWARATPGRVRAVLVRSGGELVAAALTLRCGRHHEVFEVGLREDFDHRVQAYALACFYEPVRLLVAEHGTVLDLGVGTAAAKKLRGAGFEPSYGCFVPAASA